ncbi:ATP-binding protein [Emticicia sp. BO119]|uniref:ATP-binding protein n=1 Tax=Emticicia sp. BO119 TaxID=2757768 RepID=UPI0015F068D0|nr:ATP-binding protein [Emticicia sp. BO119]MBA4853888.1 response regulator [Emticicia sp. BO119]
MKFKQLFTFISIIAVVVMNNNGYAQAPVVIDSQTKTPLHPTSSLETFRDTSAKLSFEEIRKQNFRPLGDDYFIFPYTNDVNWVRLKIENKNVRNKHWTLQWLNPLVEKLDFYISDSTKQHFTHTEYRLITKKEKKLLEVEPAFAFELAPHTSKIIYVKITSQRGHYGTISIHSPESLTKKTLDAYIEQSFTNGLLFFRFFLVVILAIFIIKLPIFRIYSLHTVFKTFTYWGLMNIPGPLFTANPDIAKKIDFLSYNSVTITNALLVLAAFATHKLPKWHKMLTYFFIFAAITIDILAVMDYQWYWLKTGLYLIVFSSFYFLTVYIYSLIKKLPTHQYYAIPFIFGMISYLLICTRLLGWLEYKPLFRLSSLLFITENFVFVFFLGQIFRSAERNKILAEQQLGFNLEQNARLKELDSLKTTFFANISHELRTPLTLILGPIQELKQKYPFENLLPLMQRNTQRLLTLINQLLDISKLEAGQMKVEVSRQNIGKYFRTLTSSFTSLAESQKIAFETSVGKEEIWGYIDRDKLDKIITNLLSNAFKFTAKEGKVTAKIESYNSKTISIAISDTGIGIKKDKLDKIFDRFYQVDSSQNRKFEGTGIGLALVKELVDVLKGSISIESKENEGTTFIIKLPVDKETWKNVISEEVSETDNHSENLTQSLIVNDHVKSMTDPLNGEQENILLIVDDNDDIRTYIKSIFEKEYQVIEAVNGKEGIDKATEKIPNLIISDLMMPEMDGFEFCKVLKSDEKTSHIPIIMLTAKANIESRMEGLELGADDYLTKPFYKEEILVRVRNLILIREKLKKWYGKEVVELKPDEIKVNSIDEAFLLKAKAIIEKNLSDSQFDLGRFAGEMAMSTVQLRRKIKALTNQTAVEFIRRYRLQRAANLLRQKAGMVSDIAYQVGFESLPYFTKVFQEEFEITPSEYANSQ